LEVFLQLNATTNSSTPSSSTAPSCHKTTLTFHEIIPCLYQPSSAEGEQEEAPKYELRHDGSGRPYANVLELRADKIRNFLEMEHYERVKSFRAVRYEQLVREGTDALIRHLEQATGLEAQCTPIPPASEDILHKAVRKYVMDPEYVEWMAEKVDWETEGRIGYTVEDVPESPLLPPSSNDHSQADETLAKVGLTAEGVSLSDNSSSSSNNNNTPNYAKTIHLIGERHSGSNRMFQHLTNCFGNQTMVSDRLSRYKHWFQDEERLRTSTSATSSDMYVVALFRNPYAWVEAMHKRGPHHYPSHRRIGSWMSFVTKPLMMARTAVDNAMPEEDRFASSATPAKCIEGFTWNEVNPCHADNYLNKKDDLDFPMYELNHRQKDGTPYFRITDLRADKIKNFMVVKDYQRVKYFRPFQYEAMVAGGEATNQLIRELEEATGLKAACAPLHESPIEQKETKFDKEFVEWMKQNVDWEAEGLVGYRKDDVPGASTETVEI